MTTPLLGVDIAVWQYPKGLPVLMARKLKRKGITFVFARASVGTRTDPAFINTIQRARDADLVVGAYHFLDDNEDGTRQATVFLSQVTRPGVGLTGLLVALDVEHTAANHPTWRDAKLWAQKVGGTLSQTQLGLYTNRASAAVLGNPDATPTFDYLWQALYSEREDLDAPGVSLPPPPKARFMGFPVTTIWQYGPCRITAPSGKKVALDGDAFYGTKDELLALARPRQKPLTERPAYIGAWNRAVADARVAAGSTTTPADITDLVAIAGYQAGRGAAVDDLNDLHLGTP